MSTAEYNRALPTLQLVRVAKGLSRRELARRAGVTPRGVAIIERGECRPNLRTAMRLAGALGMAVEDLFPDGAA